MPWLSKHAFDSSRASGYLGKMSCLLCSAAKPGAAIRREVWLCLWVFGWNLLGRNGKQTLRL